MEYQSLRPHLHKLEADLVDALREKADVDARVENLQAAIHGIKGLLGEAHNMPFPGQTVLDASPVPNGIPRGRTDRVRAVIAESGEDRTWKARQVYDALVARGWEDHEGTDALRSVEAVVNRLWKRGELRRVSSGTYRYYPGGAT
ncbi:MAG: hypothetical protein WAP35_10610 [Solirubrobacterales bacterium]